MCGGVFVCGAGVGVRVRCRDGGCGARQANHLPALPTCQAIEPHPPPTPQVRSTRKFFIDLILILILLAIGLYLYELLT